MSNKENITVYIPKTLKSAQKLFKMFETKVVKHLDEEKFFHLFAQGNGKIGFCIRNGTWQICDPLCNLFEVEVIEM